MSNHRKQQQNNSGSDPVVMIIAIVAFIALIIYALWSKYHAMLSLGYMMWRKVTVYLGWLFGEYVANIPILVKPFHDTWALFQKVKPEDVVFGQWIDTSFPVNIALLVLILIPLAICSIRTSLKTNPLNHKNYGRPRDFTVESFMKEQEKVYPYLKLYSTLNLLKHSVNEGRLRMADTPKQFVVRHNLLKPISRKDNIVIDQEKTRLIFEKQLGPKWLGMEKLSTIEIVVLGILLPKAAATDIRMTDADYEKALDTSAKLLKECWLPFLPSKNKKESVEMTPKALRDKLRSSPAFSMAVASLKQYLPNRIIQGIVKRHAYVRAIMFEVLEHARKTGVLPSADFRWLKLVDRELWYTLNTVGRFVSVPEVSGLYAHYLYEKSAGHASESPHVDTAVDALQEAFAKVIFSEDEWLSYQEKKQQQDQ